MAFLNYILYDVCIPGYNSAVPEIPPPMTNDTMEQLEELIDDLLTDIRAFNYWKIFIASGPLTVDQINNAKVHIDAVKLSITGTLNRIKQLDNGIPDN